VPARAQLVFVRRLLFIEDEPVAIHLSHMPARFAAGPEWRSDSLAHRAPHRRRGPGRLDQRHHRVRACLRVGCGHPQGPRPSATGINRKRRVHPRQEPVRPSEALYGADRFRFRIGTRGAQNLRMEAMPAPTPE
jgi:DNA-binding GntR family transcriptional regulator